VAAAWEDLTREEQRELLGLAFERVAAFNTFAWLTYRFPCRETGDTTARIHLPPAQRGARWKQKSPAE
jgi:hypothetical protein